MKPSLRHPFTIAYRHLLIQRGNLKQRPNDNAALAFNVSLKGAVAKVSQTVPEPEHIKYDAVISALQRKFGSDHSLKNCRL